MVTDLLEDDGLLDIGGKRAASHTDPAAAVKEIRGQRREMPRQNAALRDWSAPPAPEGDGACHLCGRPPRLRCQACGRGACSADSWVMLALCRTCATEERMKTRQRDGDVSENWLG